LLKIVFRLLQLKLRNEQTEADVLHAMILTCRSVFTVDFVRRLVQLMPLLR